MARNFFPVLPALFALCAAALLAGCHHGQSQVRSRGRYTYHYSPGRTATLVCGHAIAPAAAPRTVKDAISAANRIAGLPYCYGAGHTREMCSSYDCSGAASYVLCHAGLLDEPTTSTAFRHYGSRGAGRWITVCARDGHVFLVIAGLRFDTGYGGGAEGPRWTSRGRPMDGAVLRHPAGL